MYASVNGHKDAVTALVAAGANVDMKDYVSAAAVRDEGRDCVRMCCGVCVCVRVSVVCRGSYVFINISQTCNKIKFTFVKISIFSILVSIFCLLVICVVRMRSFSFKLFPVLTERKIKKYFPLIHIIHVIDTL